ncbi:LemA family protein [Candidatus Gottesmanbacteria bacterium]|nr:LemA family protein [Candidatus Gottesmanbacteria bacterium]
MNSLLFIVIILVVIGGYFLMIYNGLVKGKMQVKEAWSGIDVQLKRRADLIPNLVETVKGYAKHEKTVFENVTKARSALLGAKNPQEAEKANNMLTDALKTIFAIAENYPKLEANQNFKELQRQLEDTEDKVAYARQFYNSNTLDYNTKTQVFPSSIVAGMFGFTQEQFFGATDEDKKPVKVSFN